MLCPRTCKHVIVCWILGYDNNIEYWNISSGYSALFIIYSLHFGGISMIGQSWTLFTVHCSMNRFCCLILSWGIQSDSISYQRTSQKIKSHMLVGTFLIPGILNAEILTPPDVKLYRLLTSVTVLNPGYIE